MSFYYSILFFAMILTIFFINLDLALNMEGIIGGYKAEQKNFKFQVFILGRMNGSKERHLMCSGGIISENFVLSAAQCFIDGSRYLRTLTFSATLGTNDLNNVEAIEVDITFIYAYKKLVHVVYTDIALAQLAKTLEFFGNPYIQKVTLPKPGDSFADQIAVVAGAGYTWIKTDFHPVTRKIYRKTGSTDYKLKYAFVLITGDYHCQNTYENIDIQTHICGIMKPDTPGAHWGVCTRDTGSPLIINETIVGIVSRNTPECDDTINGCIYTNVAAYLPFINAVIEHINIDMDIYENSPHVAEIVL